MTFLTKTTLFAAAAATLATALPVQARSGNWGRGHDGIDAGDVIAGALIIGGIAAVASAGSSGRYDRGYGYRDRYDRRDRYDGYGRNDHRYGYSGSGYGSRQAVEQCVRAAQRDAGRAGWARVTDVTRINRINGGYEVRGRLVVEDRNYGGYRRGGYDRGYGYDRYSDGYDKGRFSCVTRYGRVEDVRLGGLRGYY